MWKPLSSSHHLQDYNTSGLTTSGHLKWPVDKRWQGNLLLFLQMWFMWPRATRCHCMPCVSGQTRCNPLSCMMSFLVPLVECGSLSSLWLQWVARLRARWCFMRSRWVCRSLVKTHVHTDKTITLLHQSIQSHLLVSHNPSLTACCSSHLRIWEDIFFYYADASSWVVCVCVCV